ncbi:MAG: ATP-dependent RecD-like DNA helicase [Firmicutes bacterium HGW-Firmicutes-1]|jgi:exodeoxyribonuclease V alpha subunit|nr:MAG: ATP-dependent RecD-like DNA helicase [Firmicutes bacterium HGW-Firmicutes-1]
MVVVDGIVEEIIYRNDSNGYTIITVATDSEEITIVGTLFHVAIGERIRASGTYTSHPIYGMQLKVEQFQSFMPEEIAAMERYLASGVIKGIGPSLAKRLIDQFGLDTFKVIEEQTEVLAQVKGISEKKAQEITSVFYEQKKMRQVIIFLQEFGISLTYAIKIYGEYKEKTVETVKNNPYQLAEDIHGIGFKMADSIAFRIGIDRFSAERIMAGIKYILGQSSLDGHLFLEKETLIVQAAALLGVEAESTENALTQLHLKQHLLISSRNGIEIVYLITYYLMEKYIANHLLDLSSFKHPTDKNIENELVEIEKTHEIFLDAKQKKAIIEAMNCGVLVITGGPGTGKTTTINAIIEGFENRGLEVLLAAPTGRAAKRMTETTGKEAKTIHRLLEITFGKDELHQRFERNEEYPLECDVVIIDEASMMDVTLTYHLLKAIVPGTRLILVGDKDQLPSVGPGNILKDIIKSEFIPTAILDKIFRQAMESDIILNAHKINSGEHFPLKGSNKDFFFIARSNAHHIIDEIVSLVKIRLPKFTGCTSHDGIQILTPMRKGLLGVEHLNGELQRAINPYSKDKKEKEFRKIVFREGDKVMQIRNNYNISWEIVSKYNYTVEEGLGVFNGDVGKIIEVNHYSEKIKVKFDDEKLVEYDFTNLDELELAYAITIHKSQGSEYPVVILPMFSGPPMLLTRNLLYTAVTRAKAYVVVVGMEEVLKKMIDNNREIGRNSTLDQMLRDVFSL